MVRASRLLTSLALISLFSATPCAQSQSEKQAEARGAAAPSKQVTAEWVMNTVREFVDAKARESGGFFVAEDPVLKRKYRLKLERIFDPVNSFEKSGQTIYFVCTDFKSVDGSDVLDIDFWMVQKGDDLEVIATKIHRINRDPRFTYQGVEVRPID